MKNALGQTLADQWRQERRITKENEGERNSKKIPR